jgi:glycosyltransferase involved in cell wall biosynthesis
MANQWLRFAHDIESRGLYQKDQSTCSLFPLLLASSHALIVQNDYEYSQLVGRADEAKVKIIKKGLDLTRIATNADKTYDGVWVARCEPWKNPEAFIELARLHRNSSFLMICSRVSDRDDYFLDIKKRSAVMGNIEFLDFVSNDRIYDLLSRCRIFCITSELEGDWPMSVLEAAASGLPILSLKLNYGGLVSSYGAGFLSLDIHTMSKQFVSLVSDPELYASQSNRARQYIADNHQLGRNIRELVDFISGADGPPAPSSKRP